MKKIQPITVDDEGNAVDGRHRVKAIRKPIVLQRRILSPSSSECVTSKFIKLDWTNWFQDHSITHYIHVKHSEDDTWHRVHPKTIAGYTCKRIAVYDGVAYWLYDFNHSTPTNKPNARRNKNKQKTT